MDGEQAPAVGFELGIPSYCPPTDAVECTATLLRFCRKSPPDQEDYTPHIKSSDELKRKRAELNPKDCNGWGLSVYLTEDELEFACKANPKFSKKKFVFKTKVSMSEGLILQTGKEGHYTFWPRSNVNLLGRAEFVFGPVGKVLGFVD